MAHQLSIWIPTETDKFAGDPEAAFAFYTGLAATIINQFPNTEFAYLVEDVGDDPEMRGDDEPFTSMCEYCTEDHRPTYANETAYLAHLKRAHPVEFNRDYGPDDTNTENLPYDGPTTEALIGKRVKQNREDGEAFGTVESAHTDNPLLVLVDWDNEGQHWEHPRGLTVIEE